jgi:hypothetical protein
MVMIEFPKPNVVDLVCPKCGVDAACDCGIAPIDRAEYAVLQNPEKSNRAIAAEIGVDEATVRKARKSSTAGSPAVEKRIGRDGKARRMPKPVTLTRPDKSRVLTEIHSVLQDSHQRVLTILAEEFDVLRPHDDFEGKDSLTH